MLEEVGESVCSEGYDGCPESRVLDVSDDDIPVFVVWIMERVGVDGTAHPVFRVGVCADCFLTSTELLASFRVFVFFPLVIFSIALQADCVGLNSEDGISQDVLSVCLAGCVNDFALK